MVTATVCREGVPRGAGPCGAAAWRLRARTARGWWPSPCSRLRAQVRMAPSGSSGESGTRGLSASALLPALSRAPPKSAAAGQERLGDRARRSALRSCACGRRRRGRRLRRLPVVAVRVSLGAKSSNEPGFRLSVHLPPAMARPSDSASAALRERPNSPREGLFLKGLGGPASPASSMLSRTLWRSWRFFAPAVPRRRQAD